MDILDYYKRQSFITDPKEYASSFDDLPSEVGELCKLVQNVIMHRDSSHLYDIELTEARKQEGETRYIPDILKRIFEYDPSPLMVKRPPEKRFAGVCRDFEVLLCSILRSKGIPARVRCGFAGYFTDNFEDHWLCEYWNKAEARWILVDANIDDVECKAYNVTIDVLDIPHDKYLFAGDVWQKCRNGELDADNFGVSTIGIKGLWFIRNNVVRDLAALNKVEMLPWDEWGLADKEFEAMSEADLKLLDEAAQLTIDNTRFDEMLSIYQQNESLKVPKVVKSHTTYNGIQMVAI